MLRHSLNALKEYIYIYISYEVYEKIIYPFMVLIPSTAITPLTL